MECGCTVFLVVLHVPIKSYYLVIKRTHTYIYHQSFHDQHFIKFILTIPCYATKHYLSQKLLFKIGLFKVIGTKSSMSLKRWFPIKLCITTFKSKFSYYASDVGQSRICRGRKTTCLACLNTMLHFPQKVVLGQHQHALQPKQTRYLRAHTKHTTNK
jgi:hypothetical protein